MEQKQLADDDPIWQNHPITENIDALLNANNKTVIIKTLVRLNNMNSEK